MYHIAYTKSSLNPFLSEFYQSTFGVQTHGSVLCTELYRTNVRLFVCLTGQSKEWKVACVIGNSQRRLLCLVSIEDVCIAESWTQRYISLTSYLVYFQYLALNLWSLRKYLPLQKPSLMAKTFEELFSVCQKKRRKKVNDRICLLFPQQMSF